MPLATQARAAVWTAVNPETGIRRVHEAFPPEIVDAYLDNQMMIRFKNGSTWTVAGSDNYSNFIGSSPVLITWSEWARSDPQSYSYLSPILDFNNGTAVFITTPLGRNNAAYRFYQKGISTPGWFAEKLSIEDTGMLSKERIEEIRQDSISLYGEQMGQAIFRQEFYCDWTSDLTGEVYGKELQDLQDNGHITDVSHDPNLLTHISMDLGIDDAMALTFIQVAGSEYRVIDYIENSGEGLPYYVQEINKRGYTIGQVLLPHDSQVRELGSGRSRVETMRSLGLKNIRVLPLQSVADGLNALRVILPRCWFDAKKTSRLVQSLRMYHREWDAKRQVYSTAPVHDQYSHGCDAMRYFAMGNVRNVNYGEMTPRPQGFI